jgi:hypothetical protein
MNGLLEVVNDILLRWSSHNLHSLFWGNINLSLKPCLECVAGADGQENTGAKRVASTDLLEALSVSVGDRCLGI